MAATTTTRKAADKKATDKKATDKKATDKKATDKKATDKKATDKKATDKKATDKKAADKKAADKKAAQAKQDKKTSKAAGDKGAGSRKKAKASGSEVAAELGKPSAVKRQTKAPTTAASYLTRDHDVIKKWAGGRGGTPADVRGTRKGKGAGVLRMEFQDPADRFADIDWTAFFTTFDSSDVDFLYQEHTADGSLSRFNKFVREA